MGLEERDMEPLPLKANQAALGAAGFLGRQDLAHAWSGVTGFPAPLCFCLCKPWPGAVQSHRLVFDSPFFHGELVPEALAALAGGQCC